MSIAKINTLILLAGTFLVWLFYGRIDLEVIRWSKAHQDTWIRPVSEVLSEFGLVGWWIAASLLLWLAAKYYRHDRYRAERMRFFFTAVVASGIAVVPLKYLFGKARPDKLFDENLYGFHWFVAPNDYGMHGFPSGHTTTAFTVATVLTLMFPRFGVLFYLLALLVGLSRIGVLYHYPSDVVAGAMLGTVLTLWLYRKFPFPPRETRR